MNPSIHNPALLPVTHDPDQASGAVMAEPYSAFVLEPIQVHEPTLAPVMESILQFRPTSHWGIND